MSLSPTPDLDSHAAEAIAHAERRRGKLERLSSIGMAIAEEIVAGAGRAPLGPEPGYDPSLAFAAVARSVRLTVMREADTDDGILALRRGEFPAYRPWAPDPVWADWDFAAVRSAPVRAEEVETDEAAEAGLATLEREYERLIEREDFAALLGPGGLAGDLDARIGAVRAELGLSPLHGEGRLGEAERDGEVRGRPKSGDDPDFPTPDFATLRLDPPHQGEGGSAPYRESG